MFCRSSKPDMVSEPASCHQGDDDGLDELAAQGQQGDDELAAQGQHIIECLVQVVAYFLDF